MTWLAIVLGGALGSISRYGIGLALARFEYLPFGSLTTNALGSLIIGIAAGYWDMQEDRKLPAALFVMTGFCGGFTTFSTFSLKTIELIQANEHQRAAGNITASVAICLTFTWLGFLATQSLKKSPA